MKRTFYLTFFIHFALLSSCFETCITDNLLDYVAQLSLFAHVWNRLTKIGFQNDVQLFIPGPPKRVKYNKLSKSDKPKVKTGPHYLQTK